MKSVVIASLALTGFAWSGFASVDFRTKFEAGLPGWKSLSGGNSFEVRDGGLAVTRVKGHAGGTAWELESEGFAVTPGEPVSLLLRARSTFGVRGFARAEAIGEGRELAAGGGLTDDFAPYAVHLYRLRK